MPAADPSFGRSTPRLRSGPILGATILLVVMVGITGTSASAYQRPGRMSRISVATDGTQGNATSFVPSLSADGRYVAFWSGASNLVPGDTNGADDVFVHDGITGTTERVSVASDGTEAKAGPGGAGSSHAVMSPNGRFVAFLSYARNLVSGDTNGFPDVFVHDREIGTTERVSVSNTGTQASSSSLISPAHPPPIMSADGRYVVFYSSAPNLVPGDTNGSYDVFIRDRKLETTERVSLGEGGAEANDHSFSPSISADGRRVAFHSGATNLVNGDDNASYDVFVRDLEAGTTERASVATDGAQGDGGTFGAQYAAISADGRHVVFYDWSGTLVPADGNETADVFVRDLEKKVTERVSVASDGTEGDGSSGYASISGDGRFVAFYSNATNLVPNDTNKVGTGGQDVFVHDRVTKTTERVSVSDEGTEGNNGSWFSSISADGRHVALQSFASNLVPGDTNTWGSADAFVRDRGPALGVGELSVSPAAAEVSISGWATFSGQEVVSAKDPGDDGASVGPLAARDVGAELEGAAVVYRVEQEDLLLQLKLASLPGPAPLVGAGLTYGLAFELEGIRYEVRAAAVEVVAPGSPHVVLHRCDPECRQEAILTGSIGTVGPEVRVSLPFLALGVEEGTTLTGLRAFVNLGDGTTGALSVLDELALPDATIPAAVITFGIAPAGVPEGDVTYDTQAAHTGGIFTASRETSGLAEGDHRVWARACLGDECAARSTPLG